VSAIPPDGLSSVYDGTLDCVHCGLCLTACPTYLETGRETSSPRGRIYLMRGAAEGRVSLSGLLAEEAHLCLGCRACETACPAGVRYGAMLEETRAAIHAAGARPGLVPRLERFVLRRIVAHKARLRTLVALLGVAQGLGLDRALSRLLPGALRDVQALLPRVPAARDRVPLPELTPAQGERRGRVAFFTGCVMSELFAPVQQASVRVLAANGFEVLVPRGQGCCGALHAHAGDLDHARGLARHNSRIFADTAVDAIVVDSAGCGAALRDAGHWIPGEGEPLAARIRDVCELLDEHGLRPPRGRFPGRVCYDDPCHLVHGQGVEAAPRRLLAQVPGLELVPHAGASRCCGAAGTYNLTQPAMSAAILEAKLDSLLAAQPDVVATGNPGCMMQIAKGVRQRGASMRVVHPVEILDAAYRSDQPTPV
jgi:Fe-S oxidoreductase